MKYRDEAALYVGMDAMRRETEDFRAVEALRSGQSWRKKSINERKESILNDSQST